MLNKGYTYTDRISKKDEGVTALEYFASRHVHFTRAQWLQRFDAGNITCSGSTLGADTRLRAKQIIRYFREPWMEPGVPTEIPLLFQDENVMAFDKPDAMPVLPGGMFLENSMVMVLRRKHGEASAPLHRLGRGTTGAILFTKTRDAAARFSLMMRERRITKTYFALVHGCGMPDKFTIETPIGRVPHARLGSVHDVTPQGKQSQSICTVIERHEAGNTALLQVVIPTGRTHQIRIHLAAEGYPLIGDLFYRGPASTDGDHSDASSTALPGDPGYILHSWKIEYTDPFSGLARKIVAPVRDEIEAWRDERHRAMCSIDLVARNPPVSSVAR